MRTAAVLPVKRFSAAKRRLGESVADPLRIELARAMVGDVLSALRQSAAIEATIVVTCEPAVVAAARCAGAIVVDDTAESGQSAAVSLGLARARGDGFERALCVPGDCPALDPDELDALLGPPPSQMAARPAAYRPRAAARMPTGESGRGESGRGESGRGESGRGESGRERRAEVAIVPDRHGTGTNGLLLSPPDAIDPSFGPDSRARHEQLARAAGVAYRIERPCSLLLDVDTGDDLAVLRERLAGEHVRAPRTRAVLGLTETRWQSSRPAA
jgi:2-phospho-L-lactate guanylyltransferase